MDPEAAEVKASGGVVWRRAGDGALELVVVHRPRYDDWSLPKGKLDPGETLGGGRAARGRGGGRAALPARRRAPARELPRQQGAREGRPLLADGAGGRRARRSRRTTRWTRCAGSTSARRPALLELPARRRARAGRGRRAYEPRALPGRSPAAGRASTGRPARRWSTSRSRRWTTWMRSGRGANHGGAFAAAQRDRRVRRGGARGGRAAARRRRREDVAFGPSMTAMTMRLVGGRRAHARRRATRSSSRGSTTTPTCAPG